MNGNDWAVYRLDFSGNEFLVERGLTRERAEELVLEYEARKHHQHYWARQRTESSVDYAQMLRESLNAGSSLDMSLHVLRNQKATETECIKAVCEVLGQDLDTAIKAVSKSR